MSQAHSDPIAEGLQQGGQRLVQIVSAAVAVNQAVAQRKNRLRAAQKAADAQAQREEAQSQRAALAEARSRWRRAHDRKWLRRANLPDVARAWGAAAPYAEDNASAAFAVRNCEERLRDLHPHAMSHYDRIRSDGKDRLDAMTQAAPFFTRAPDVRTGEPGMQRGELHEGTGHEWAAKLHGPDRAEWEAAQQERRATQIADELRTKLRLQGHEIGPEELRTVLEIVTNLPEDVIAKVVSSTPQERPTHRSDACVAAEDFPLTISEALEMSSRQPFEAPAARRASPQVPDRNRRRNL